MVPLRPVFEALGAEVKWDGSTQTATASKGDKEIILTVGSDLAYCGLLPIPLDQPAQIINGSTMVPVRFVSESLGCNVSWEPASNTVAISSVIKTTESYKTKDKTGNLVYLMVKEDRRYRFWYKMGSGSTIPGYAVNIYEASGIK